MQIKKYIQRINIELFIWPIALILLFLMDPLTGGHYSLCVLKWLGFSWCPGCGLGHSIHYSMHGEWKAALRSHPLGPLAVVILGYRCVQLGRLQLASFSELKNHYT